MIAGICAATTGTPVAEPTGRSDPARIAGVPSDERAETNVLLLSQQRAGPREE
jgi:hypothetical protein